MKFKAPKWLSVAPVAAALVISLAACGGGTSEPSGSPTDALAGSDQKSLDTFTTADVTPLDKIDKSKLGLATDGTLRVGTLSDAPPNIFIDPSGNFTGYDNELLRAIGEKLGLKVEFASMTSRHSCPRWVTSSSTSDPPRSPPPTPVERPLASPTVTTSATWPL
jgi:polar amino acid transport system substrate-binding protein